MFKKHCTQSLCGQSILHFTLQSPPWQWCSFSLWLLCWVFCHTAITTSQIYVSSLSVYNNVFRLCWVHISLSCPPPQNTSKKISLQIVSAQVLLFCPLCHRVLADVITETQVFISVLVIIIFGCHYSMNYISEIIAWVWWLNTGIHSPKFSCITLIVLHRLSEPSAVLPTVSTVLSATLKQSTAK